MPWRASFLVFIALFGYICGHLKLHTHTDLRTYAPYNYIKPPDEINKYRTLYDNIFQKVNTLSNEPYYKQNTPIEINFLRELYGKPNYCMREPPDMEKQAFKKNNNIYGKMKLQRDESDMNENRATENLPANTTQSMAFVALFNKNRKRSCTKTFPNEDLPSTSRQLSPTTHASLIAALPVSHYPHFFNDLILDNEKQNNKRSGTAPIVGCECKVKNDLMDLGQHHFPRYLLNAICQSDHTSYEYPQKCWRGSICKPLEYKVKVLTFRTDMEITNSDPALAWLPDDLRQLWKFKTVTVSAGCFCSY